MTACANSACVVLHTGLPVPYYSPSLPPHTQLRTIKPVKDSDERERERDRDTTPNVMFFLPPVSLVTVSQAIRYRDTCWNTRTVHERAYEIG